MLLSTIARIVRRQWPALLVLVAMGGISALIGYELYGRWRYAEQVKKAVNCPDLPAFRLPEGRSLSYRESGSPNGRPVFYFHGAVGSAAEWPLSDKHDLHLIALDRPGYGCSTAKRGRSFEDWAQDVRQVADQLGWKRFGVIGFSAGAPHALAVAYYLPDRVSAVSVIGTIRAAPFTRLRLLAPGIAYEIFSTMRQVWAKDPEQFEVQSSRNLPECDKSVYFQPEILERFKTTHARSLRESVAGVYEDLRLLGTPWSFDPAALKVPVRMWHGEEDRVAPIGNVEPLFRSIPHVQVKRIAGEGHFLYYRHEQEILGSF